MDSVLRGLKRLDTHKETTLLILGHIAKYVKKMHPTLDDCLPGEGLLWVTFQGGPSVRYSLRSESQITLSAELHTYRRVKSWLIDGASLMCNVFVVDAAREILQEISL